jgi:hypothetical protein
MQVEIRPELKSVDDKKANSHVGSNKSDKNSITKSLISRILSRSRALKPNDTSDYSHGPTISQVSFWQTSAIKKLTSRFSERS